MKQKKRHVLKRTLQIRFVLLAALAATLLLGSIVGIVLLRSLEQIERKADHLLVVIRTAPDSAELGDARFITVTLSPADRSASADLSHTTLTQEKAAIELGRKALKTGKQQGFLDDYRYSVVRNGDTISIYLLSRRVPLETYRDTRRLLLTVSLAGLSLTVAVLALLSGRVVAPVAEAHEKQKTFVTSASHALKTPVAVILGDTQLLQIELPDNEWICDIEKQANRLTDMTRSLVTLSRWDEGSAQSVMLDFPISDLAEDIAASFRGMTAGRSLTFETDIAPGLSYRGDEKALREMMTILLDNAFRYCPDSGTISFRLEKQHRNLRLCVTNSARDIHKEELCRFTERFYRGSTAGETSGSGLGLSIAQSIVRKHRGKLTVTAPNDKEISIQILL